MTKHAFPAQAFCEQKRYMCRHLIKLRGMKLRRFSSKAQEMNGYLAEFLPNTEGQQTAPLPAGEIMDITYHTMSTTWKNKMNEQKF